MKKGMDKLRTKMKQNKKIIIFLITLLLVAVAFGSIFTVLLKIEDKDLVLNYFEDYASNIKDAKYNFLNTLKNGTITNFGMIIIIWLLGISIIGIPIVLFLYFSKLFIIGFTTGCMILKYGIKGTLISFLYLFPSQIINIGVYIYLEVFALMFSYRLLLAVIKKKNMDFKLIMNKYAYVLLICGIFVTFTTLYDSILLPIILKNIL